MQTIINSLRMASGGLSSAWAPLLAITLGQAVWAQPHHPQRGKIATTAPASIPATVPSRTSFDNEESRLELEKLRAEVDKLKLEVEDLRSPFSALRAWLTGFGALFTALTAGAVAWVGYRLNSTQEAKLKQDKAQGRREHLLRLFHELGDQEAKVRLGAVAVLLQRLTERPTGESPVDLAEKQDASTIASVLIAVTKHESDIGIQKRTADGLARALGAIIEDRKTPREASESPLKPYDFQRAQFQDAYWKRVDARDIDFFKANFSWASLKEAFLSGAVFMEANLEEAVLRDADLKGANLQGAKLRGAKLQNAQLVGANLAQADLSQANLDGANLSRACLDGANLQGASQIGMLLKGAKYDTAQGLDLQHAILEEKETVPLSQII